MTNSGSMCQMQLQMFSQFLSSLKVTQVKALIERKLENIQQIFAHQLRENFLLFHLIHNALPYFIPRSKNLHSILADFGHFLSS